MNKVYKFKVLLLHKNKDKKHKCIKKDEQTVDKKKVFICIIVVSSGQCSGVRLTSFIGGWLFCALLQCFSACWCFL